MNKTTIKTQAFDAANYLHTEQDMALHVQLAMEEGDPALVAAALGDIARAKGMSQLARETGLSRESLYKSLSGERIPNTETIFKVIKALGLKLTVTPAI